MNEKVTSQAICCWNGYWCNGHYNNAGPISVQCSQLTIFHLIIKKSITESELLIIFQESTV